jgi:hypothetical protein
MCIVTSNGARDQTSLVYERVLGKRLGECLFRRRLAEVGTPGSIGERLGTEERMIVMTIGTVGYGGGGDGMA